MIVFELVHRIATYTYRCMLTRQLNLPFYARPAIYTYRVAVVLGSQKCRPATYTYCRDCAAPPIPTGSRVVESYPPPKPTATCQPYLPSFGLMCHLNLPWTMLCITEPFVRGFHFSNKIGRWPNFESHVN